MFARLFEQRFLSTSAIALVLLATLPEVICCCDISWGPGGLVGNAVPCREMAKSARSCCCCPNEQRDEGDCPLENSEESSPCTFSCVSPPPMNHSEVVDGDHALTLLYFRTTYFVRLTDAGQPAPISHLDWRPPAPAPGAHCALLQIWRI